MTTKNSTAMRQSVQVPQKARTNANTSINQSPKSRSSKLQQSNYFLEPRSMMKNIH